MATREGRRKEFGQMKRGGKTTSGNGQAWSVVKNQRAVENMENWRENWLQSHLGSAKYFHDRGIDDDNDDDDLALEKDLLS